MDADQVVPSPAVVPDRPKDQISCAMGVYCYNVRKKYYDWLERQQARESGGASSSVDDPQPPNVSRGMLVSLASALQNHPACFLPCGHFCCDWAPEVALRLGILKPGQCCAIMHATTRCNNRGVYNFDALWTAAAHHNMLTVTRPGRVRGWSSEFVSCTVCVGA
jgi:hypothetical protein